MELIDSRTIKAPKDQVWAALNSADVLKECVPGCQTLTGSAADGFDAVVVQKIGPVKATFKGRVTLSDIVQGESYRITGEGKGGAAGFAKGGALVKLSQTDDLTTLTYEVEARVGGKIAQLGSRLIDGFAKKMAGQFFERFQQQVEGPPPDGEYLKEDPKQKGWLKKLIS